MIRHNSAKDAEKIIRQQTLEKSKWTALQAESLKNNFSHTFSSVLNLQPPKNVSEWITYFFLLSLTLQLTIPAARGEPDTHKGNRFNITPNYSDDVATNSSSPSLPKAQEDFEPSLQLAKQPHGIILQNKMPSKTDIDTKKNADSTVSKNSYPSTNPKPPKNSKAVMLIFAEISRVAPDKLNQGIDCTVQSTQKYSFLQCNSSLKNKHEALKKQERFNEFNKSIKDADKLIVDLRRELITKAKSDPIYVKTAEVAAINTLYFQAQNYVIGIFVNEIHNRVSRNFQGGNCAAHSAIAMMEALRRGLNIEMVELVDKVDPTHTHTFPIIGRKKESNLSNPETWGRDTMILDYWAYDALITNDELIRNRTRFGLYFSENWLWSSEIYSPQLPARLRENIFYKTHAQFRRYVAYCEQRITEFIEQGVDLFDSAEVGTRKKNNILN